MIHRASISSSSLGHVLVVTGGGAVRALALADHLAPLEAERIARWPAALDPDDGEHAALARAALAVVDDRAGSLPPLDGGGTPFQRRVWDALRAIPRGETRSYAELARAIGAPEAVRAVGAACGRNPIAVLVPCHRVVRADGRLGGYRWGLPRKEALLRRERG